MPVTARLSKGFYDQFGEQVTNELVEWLNQVDLTCRTEKRTLNDTNFARFEALLAAQFAQADVRLERRLGESDSRVVLRSRGQDQAIGASRSDLERAMTQHLRWMIGLWMANGVALVSIALAVLARG